MALSGGGGPGSPRSNRPAPVDEGCAEAMYELLVQLLPSEQAKAHATANITFLKVRFVQNACLVLNLP